MLFRFLGFKKKLFHEGAPCQIFSLIYKHLVKKCKYARDVVIRRELQQNRFCRKLFDDSRFT